MDRTAALLQKTETGKSLVREEAEELMETLLSGRMATPEVVRLLNGMNRRPIEVAELAGFARVMRRHSARVFAGGEFAPEKMVDLCGTGGDGSGTFNISTAAAIVAAAAGATVAKHGNRAVSSKSGSADVLEALGVRLDISLEQSGRAIRELGIGFLFAPAAHSATRHAVSARKQIGERTVFNLLGPLTNPAGAQRQVAGVYSADVLDVMAETLSELGVEQALILHGAGGLDEISPAGETQIAEVNAGTIRRFTVAPEDFGMQRADLSAIRGGSPMENAARVRSVLEGESGAARDVVVMNAAAALVVSEQAADFRAGAHLAEQAILSGAALAKLEKLKIFTHRDSA